MSRALGVMTGMSAEIDTVKTPKTPREVRTEINQKVEKSAKDISDSNTGTGSDGGDSPKKFTKKGVEFSRTSNGGVRLESSFDDAIKQMGGKLKGSSVLTGIGVAFTAATFADDVQAEGVVGATENLAVDMIDSAFEGSALGMLERDIQAFESTQSFNKDAESNRRAEDAAQSNSSSNSNEATQKPKPVPKKKDDDK